MTHPNDGPRASHHLEVIEDYHPPTADASEDAGEIAGTAGFGEIEGRSDDGSDVRHGLGRTSDA